MSYATDRVAPEKAVFRPALPSFPTAGLQPEKPMKNISWSEQYKHPNWQRKRLEAMEAASFRCENCGDADTTLNVHHRHYVKGRKVWEYELHELSVLCEPCHETEHDNKELLNLILMEIGPGSVRAAACLIGGYWDALCQLDTGVGEMVKKADPLYYELGMAAACLESLGMAAWREPVIRLVKQGPSTPTMDNLVDEWKKR